jgi:hypothetical protein
MKAARTALFLGFWFFWGTLPAHGFGKTWPGTELERLIAASRLRVGPFYVKTVFSLSNAGYDSNVYRTPDHQLADYSLMVGPAWTIYWPIQKKVVFTLFESPRYVYFHKTVRERTWNNFLTGRFQLALSRVLVTAEAGYAVAREIWNTEIDIRPQRKTASALTSILWQPSGVTSFMFEVREFQFRYEDLAFNEILLSHSLNHRERAFDAALFYQISGQVRARIQAGYASYIFDSPESPRDSESRSVFGSIDFGATGIVSGQVRLGLKYFKPFSPGSSEFKGLAGDSAVGLRLGKNLKLRASYAEDVQFSMWAGYVYFVEHRFGGGVSVYVSPSFRLDYDFSSGRNAYSSASQGGGSSSGPRDDRLQDHTIGFYYRIKERIGLGIIVTRWERNSTVSSISGRRTFVGANLIYDF